MDSNGDTLVRAFKSTGEQLWQSEISGSQNASPQGVGDNFGGLLLIGSSQNNGLPSGIMTDLDGQSGSQNWQYTTSGYSAISFSAVGLDGSVYAVESDLQGGHFNSYVDSFNGSSGGLQARIQLPESLTYFHCPTETDTAYTQAMTGSPAVGPDGSLYMEVASFETVEESNCESGPQPFFFSNSNSNLSLMRISPDSGVGFSTLDSSSASGTFSTGDVIPDGQGGVLAAWINSSNAPVIADVGPSGGAQTNSPISIQCTVLGDNNVAFATDEANIMAFSVPSLTTTWTYASTGGTLSLSATTRGGRISVNDNVLGLIQIDETGTASTPVSALKNAVPFDNLSFIADPSTVNWGPWVGISSGGGVGAIAGPIEDFAPSVYGERLGNGQAQHSSAAQATPVNFQQKNVALLNEGSLFFKYTWSSSTNKQEDLALCTVGESVFFGYGGNLFTVGNS